MFSSRTLWMSQHDIVIQTQKLHLNALAAMRIPALCLRRMQAQQAAEEPTIKGEAGEYLRIWYG
jgi:hypothetical protein